MNLNINISIGGDWSDDPLKGLVALHEAGKQLDAQIWSTVRQAKLAGHTWEEIGRTMGLSKQTVFERYAPAVRNSEQALSDFLAATPVGTTVPGRITSKTSFGAFVEVADDVEGLVHTSETAVPIDELHVGDDVEVTLERFHLDKRRIAFSLAAPKPKARKRAPSAKKRTTKAR